jgi:hypothetical protein
MPREGAADAFALVGNEHRVAILRALLDAHADPEAPYPTPFARLRERAGVDVSAQFAYHLEELVGAFVARTGDGYRLRYAGWKAAAALAAGTYTTQPAFGPTAIDGACAHCESNALHASYGDAWLTVTCHDCERVLTRYPFPPGAAADRLDQPAAATADGLDAPDAATADHNQAEPDSGLDALLAAFDDRVRSHFALAVDGVCPECAGRMDTALEPTEGDAQNATRGDGHDCHAVADCTQCGNHLTIPVGCVLLADPDALAFAASHDVALADRPFWRVPALAAPDRVTWTANNSPASDSGATDSLEATVALTDDSDASDGSKDSDGSDASDDTDAPAVVVTGDLDVELPDRD